MSASKITPSLPSLRDSSSSRVRGAEDAGHAEQAEKERPVPSLGAGVPLDPYSENSKERAVERGVWLTAHSRLAFAVSAGAHLAALATLWFVSPQVVDRDDALLPTPTLRVGLLPRNPRIQPEAQGLAQPEASAEPAQGAVAESQPAPALEREVSAPASEVLESAVGAETVLLARDPELPAPQIRLPSLSTIQATLGDLRAVQEARRGLSPCTAGQRKSELIDCEEQLRDDETARFERLEQNPVARALQPVRQRSRSERTVKQIAAESGRVAKDLGTLAIPADLSGYLLEEVEAGLSLGSRSGNLTTERMQRMTDKSAAGAMAERLLSDPWLQNAVRERRERRVVD